MEHETPSTPTTPPSSPEEPRHILVCVAWPYANGNLHLGHLAGSLLSPDIFARYHRGMGNRVLMVSGSDEHGTPIAVRAKAEGKTPQEIIDRFRVQTLEDLDNLSISFDLFFRTSDPNHKKVVQDIFLDLLEKGHIYSKATMEAYCPSCQNFLPDRFIEGTCPHCGSTGARGDQCDECGKPLEFEELLEPRCKDCGATPGPRETEHYYLRLSAFSKQLQEFIDSRGHMKKRVISFSQEWLDSGLRDRPITRDINWGIEIPEIPNPALRIKGLENKRIYVWFEAVIGYFSTSIEWARRAGKSDAWKDWWQNPESRAYYFMGKDNIPFHSIIFPSILMGYGEGKGGFNLPYDIPANAYLQLDNVQLSKSKGHFITVREFLEDYSVDALRYHLTLMMPENRDANFVLREFITSINSELVGNLGNFIHRTLSFAHKHFGAVPEPGELGELDGQALEDMKDYAASCFAYMETCQFKRALKEIMALSQKANVYFDRKAPWKDIKENREAAATTLYISLQFAKVLSHMFYPVLPKGAQKLWTYLLPGLDEKTVDLRTATYPLLPGTKLERPDPLFTKLETEKNKAKREARELQKKRQTEETAGDGPGFDELDLRVGTVVSVEPHPEADRLYVLKVRLGSGEERQLVAGIKPYYQEVELLSRKVVIICNLKPAELRGVLSQGMLLAAEKKKVVSVLTAPGAENGAQVKLLLNGSEELIGYNGKTKDLDISTFASFALRIGVLDESSGEKLVKFSNEAYPVNSKFGIPKNGRLVALQKPQKGILVVEDRFLGTHRSEIKPGAKIK